MKAVIYVLVALVAGAVGFMAYKHTSQSSQPPVDSSAQTAAATDSNEPAAEEQSSGVPDVLPDFSLADIDGNPRSIRSWPDKSMIVNFWATWCAPCRREIPLLKELQQTYGPEGVQVVGVAVDVREDVLKYAQEIGIDYPVIMGENDAMQALGKMNAGFGLPITVFTDNQHRVVLTHMGELHKPQAVAILDVIARVNRGELTPLSGRSMAAAQLEKLDAAAH